MIMLPPMFWSEKTNTKKIKDFSINGTIADDRYIPGHKIKMEKFLDTQMRDLGYVPHLDLDILYYISYNEENKNFNFECISFGVYVGKKKAQKIVGLSGSQFISKE